MNPPDDRAANEWSAAFVAPCRFIHHHFALAAHQIVLSQSLFQPQICPQRPSQPARIEQVRPHGQKFHTDHFYFPQPLDFVRLCPKVATADIAHRRYLFA